AHRIVRVSLGIVGITHAELVECVHMKMLAQFVKIQTPMVGAVEGAVFAAMNQHEIIAGSGFEVSCSDAVQVYEFCVVHYSSFRRFNLASLTGTGSIVVVILRRSRRIPS